MKVTYTNRQMKLVAENPDDQLIADLRRRLRAAVEEEIRDFFEEVRVAFRNLPEGQSITLFSKPIEVLISREFPDDEEQVDEEVASTETTA